MTSPSLSELDRQVSSLRANLAARFGWTHLSVELELDEPGRTLRAEGSVVVPRVATELARVLGAKLPAGWSVDVSRVALLQGTEHRTLLQRVTPLWQRIGGALATELALEDGPVEVLARVNTTTLVRATDGTLGWVERELGARVPAPALESPRPDWEGLGCVLLGFLGAPYRLGGTLQAGVDCSGLVQRSYRVSQRILLPRHSTDQLRMTLDSELPSDRPSQQSGDLVFTWTEREGPCHVGVVIVDEDPVVIHASLSRRAVVRDPLARFVDRARRVEWIPRWAIETVGRQNAGKSRLILPEPEP